MHFVVLCIASLFVACTAQNGDLAAVDPLAAIQPLPAHLALPPATKSDGGIEGDFDIGAAGSDSTTTGGRSRDSSASNKRDVDGNLVSVAAGNGAAMHRFVVERDQLIKTAGESGDCSHTFLLPPDIPDRSRVCVASSAQVSPAPARHQGQEQGGCANERRLTDLYRQVLTVKSQVETARNDILREKQRPSRETAQLQRDVSYLKQETRIANDRVSQLHTQLLHEMVNKRDGRAEVLSLENRLLNQTVKLYALREQHARLQTEHSALQSQVTSLSEQLEKLQRIVENAHGGERREQRRGANNNQRAKQTAASSSVTDPLMAIETRAVESASPQRGRSNRRRARAGPFRDCSEVQRSGYTRSGIYKLRVPRTQTKMRVWCDLDQDPGGWTVIQRRSADRVNFDRNMAGYKRGFGALRGDYWLGLDNIHRLTNQTHVHYKLHIDLEDWEGRSTFVEYQSFRIDSEEDGYKLHIAHYSGNAGDSLTWHNNMMFTTSDVDKDRFPRNCALLHKAGWWFNACAHSNLNGIYYRASGYRGRYQDGVYWSEWRGESYSLKSVSMKIRPIE